MGAWRLQSGHFQQLQHIDGGGVRAAAFAAEDVRGNATPSASTLCLALRIQNANTALADLLHTP